MTGVLYGVGVGPGDPELITRKAWALIESARVIAYPVLENASSFARRIAEDAISRDAREIEILIPMSVERAPAQAAYDTGAEEIAAALRAGEDVVVLCEGDPFFYGSFMYLHARLRDEFRVEVVPGVSSLMACAAVSGQPLSARNEVLTILPGPLDDAELADKIRDAGSVAIMKIGRHFERIKSVVAELGLLEQAYFVKYASLPEEGVTPLSEMEGPAPYFSMILINRVRDPWL